MNNNKKLIRIVFVFFVFSLFFSRNQTYAYWTNQIEYNTIQTNKVLAIGKWYQEFTWNASMIYKKGDQVIVNGIKYEARRKNQNIIPGDDWWTFWWVFWKEV